MTAVTSGKRQNVGRQTIPEDTTPPVPAVEQPAFVRNPMLSLRSQLDELTFRLATAQNTLGHNEAVLGSLRTRRQAAEDLLALAPGDSRAQRVLSSLAEPIRRAEEAVARDKAWVARVEALLASFNQNYRAEMEAQERREKLRRQIK